MHRFHALIFDCDGTLVDSERLGMEVIVEVAREHGAMLEVAQAMRQFRGGSMSDCVALIESMRGSPVPDDFVLQTRARMEERFRRDLRAIEGAYELLAGITVPMAVASNGPRTKIELSLTITKLIAFFRGRIYSAYDIGHFKPRPELFEHAAREMNVAPCDCAVIEDSVPGIEAALAAGMTTFVLRHEHLELPPHLVDRVRVVDALAELARTLVQSEP